MVREWISNCYPTGATTDEMSNRKKPNPTCFERWIYYSVFNRLKNKLQRARHKLHKSESKNYTIACVMLFHTFLSTYPGFDSTWSFYLNIPNR